MHAKVWLVDTTGKVGELVKQHKLFIEEEEGGGGLGGPGRPGPHHPHRPGLN